MADNIDVTEGTGKTVATDDVAGVQYQQIKNYIGADGVATVLVGGAGAVAAGVLRTTLASDDPAVVSVQIMDDWDESDRAKVNPIVGQAGVAAGAGAVGATVIRTTLASDDPAVAKLGTIDTSASGSATSLAVMDDWDESDRAKVNPIVGQAGITGGAGAVGAACPRVTIATDDATAVNINNALVGEYETIAASQTAQVMGGSGATGDYFVALHIIPATTSPGNVIILDNATSITVFAGGASSVLTLHPFTINLGMKSASGAWKVTTGANVSCIAVGNFSA